MKLYLLFVRKPQPIVGDTWSCLVQVIRRAVPTRVHRPGPRRQSLRRKGNRRTAHSAGLPPEALPSDAAASNVRLLAMLRAIRPLLSPGTSTQEMQKPTKPIFTPSQAISLEFLSGLGWRDVHCQFAVFPACHNRDWQFFLLAHQSLHLHFLQLFKSHVATHRCACNYQYQITNLQAGTVRGTARDYSCHLQ